MKIFIFLALLAVSFAAQEHWAVIVAGSKGFYNYRHQADICHAYAILSKSIPADHIITFSYDDVASSSQNPYPNTLYNKPGNDVPEYYADCKIDYKGNDVTPENFLAALKGTGSGKVLKSTSEDTVFINFADHGAVNLIAFPNSYLYADDLNAALKYMHEHNMYKKLVFYLEACESGSMFDKELPSDINIYATTAANPNESSWGTYCPPDDVVNGKEIGSCLGDLYSINWMEDSDKADMSKETLAEQFTNVKKLTTKSEVCEYGDTSFKTDVIGAYQGNEPAAKNGSIRKSNGLVDQRDAKMNYLFYKYLRSGSPIDAANLQQEITQRNLVDLRFQDFATMLAIDSYGTTSDVNDYACFKAAVETYQAQCGDLEEYTLKYVSHFAAACNANVPYDLIHHTIQTLCQ